MAPAAQQPSLSHISMMQPAVHHTASAADHVALQPASHSQGMSAWAQTSWLQRRTMC